METTLHRQLKALYCPDLSQQEVTLDGYRIDAIQDERLIEIQYGSLLAIRDKVRDLLENHRVLVVKPLAARKYLIKRNRKKGKIISSRYSPARETFHHLFLDLVHFVGVFPHPGLVLEVVLTEQEEHRLPKPKRRWRSKDYRVEDRKLRSVQDRLCLRTTADLTAMLPDSLSQQTRDTSFSTGDIAREAGMPRWLAQKMAYCLRKTGAAEIVGKSGNSLLYRLTDAAESAAA